MHIQARAARGASRARRRVSGPCARVCSASRICATFRAYDMQLPLRPARRAAHGSFCTRASSHHSSGQAHETSRSTPTFTMDGYAFSSCDLARLAEVDGLRSDTDDSALPSEERIRQNIIQVPACPERRPPLLLPRAAQWLRAHTSGAVSAAARVPPARRAC